MALTVEDCRKAANVVRTMLLRIQTQRGISFEDLNLADDGIGIGSASSSGEQISPMSGIDTSSSLGGYNYSKGTDLSSANLGDFGMAQPSIVPAEGCNVTGLQQHTDMADLWGASQTQYGYDWVSHHRSAFLSSLVPKPTGNIEDLY